MDEDSIVAGCAFATLLLLFGLAIYLTIG